MQSSSLFDVCDPSITQHETLSICANMSWTLPPKQQYKVDNNPIVTHFGILRLVTISETSIF